MRESVRPHLASSESLCGLYQRAKRQETTDAPLKICAQLLVVPRFE